MAAQIDESAKELASLLEVVRANVCSLMQEWNAVEMIISNVLLDCQKNYRVNPVSHPKQHGDILNAEIKYSNSVSAKVNTNDTKAVSTDLIPKENVSPCHETMATKEESCVRKTKTMNMSYPVSDYVVSFGTTELDAMALIESPVMEESNSLCGVVHSHGHHSLPDITVCSETSLWDDYQLSKIGPLLCDHTSNNSSNLAETTKGTLLPFCDVTFPSSSFSPNAKAEKNSAAALVQVRRSDLDRLTAEAMMLKECLPMVVNAYYISCVGRVPMLEEKLGKVRKEKESMVLECKNLRRRNDLLMADLEEGKKEFFSIKNELRELKEVLTQQADYCSSMGSACCMLLWRVSRHEDCIQSILSGTKVKEFLELAGNTLFSFLEAYKESALPEESSTELQFVLALCGTITNIAASTYGRDFLSNCEDGKRLIDTLCSVAVIAPFQQNYCKLRSLLLMALYNISINAKGILYLTNKPKLFSELTWLLQEETDATNRLHTLRLLQSMILEQGSLGFIQEGLEDVTIPLLRQLATDHKTEVRSIAMEMLTDIASLCLNGDRVS